MFACWCPSTKRPGLFFSFLGYSRNKLWTHVVGGGGYGELWVIVNYTALRIERGSSMRLRVLFRAAVFVHSRAGSCSCQKIMNLEKKTSAPRGTTLGHTTTTGRQSRFCSFAFRCLYQPLIGSVCLEMSFKESKKERFRWCRRVPRPQSQVGGGVERLRCFWFDYNYRSSSQTDSFGRSLNLKVIKATYSCDPFHKGKSVRRVNHRYHLPSLLFIIEAGWQLATPC